MEPVSRFKLKLALTALVLAVVELGALVPLPGVDHLVLPASRWRSLGPGFSLFGAGVLPYIGAAMTLLLVSGFVPPLRRMREGSRIPAARFDQLIVALCLLGVALDVSGRVRILGPGFYHAPAAAVFSQVGGAALLLALVFTITRFGVGNGVSWVLLFTILRKLPYYVILEHQRLTVPGHSKPALPVAAAAVGVLLLQIVFLRSTLALHLVPRRPGPGAPPERPLRFIHPVHSVGVIPILAVGFLIGKPTERLWAWTAHDHIGPGWFLYLGLVAVVALFFTAVTTDTGDTAGLLRRYGYREAESDPERDPARSLEDRFSRLVPLTVLFVVLLASLPGIFGTVLGMPEGTGRYLVVDLLVAAALILDLYRQMRVQYRMEGRPDPVGPDADREEAPLEGDDDGREEPDETDSMGEGGGDETPENPVEWMREVFRPSPGWVAAAECDVELEARILQDVLSRRGIPSEMLTNRWLSAAGTLGLWTVSRPRYPSLIPHRRLGEGRVTVLVPRPHAPAATEIVAASARSGEAAAAPDPVG